MAAIPSERIAASRRHGLSRSSIKFQATRL
jgi:hypothetical protein